MDIHRQINIDINVSLYIYTLRYFQNIKINSCRETEIQKSLSIVNMK